MPVASGPNSNRHRVNKGQDPFPPRTHKVQKNRESIDLDDVMGGSDDDYPPATPAKHTTPLPTTPKRPGQHIVSAGTRDLMNFLAEGPPGLGGSHDRVDFLSDGPSSYTTESVKPKGSGRLQRMISKLSLGNADKSKGSSDDFRGSKAPQTPVKPTANSQYSVANLSSLANRPIPPRPPRPISPPSSPSRDSSDDQNYNSPRSRGQSFVQHAKRPSVDDRPSESSPASPHKEYNGSVSSNRRPPLPANANGHSSNRKPTIDDSPEISPRIAHAPAPTTPEIPSVHPTVESPTHRREQRTSTAPSRKPAPVYVAAPSKSHFSGTDAQDMHRLLSKATSADECRLLFDMFLARSGVSVGPTDYDIPYPSPSPSVASRTQVTQADAALEHSLIELMLGGDSLPQQSPRRRRAKKKSIKTDAMVTDPLLHSSHGDKKATNGSHRVENGEPHGNHRSLPELPGGKEALIGASGNDQNHISEVVT